MYELSGLKLLHLILINLFRFSQKVIPHLLKSQKYHQRSNQSTPSKRDNASMRSEPTITTELVTASVEQEQDSVPSSLMVTPVKTPRNSEDIEMTYTSQERINNQ